MYAKPLVSVEGVDLSQVERILIIRFRGQLGDFLLSTPAIKALHHRFPKAQIGIIVRSYFADIVVDNPLIQYILVYYENGLKWTPKRIWRLWSQLYHKWDLTVVFSLEGHSLTSDILAHLSGAKYILGSDRFIFPGCTRNFFYNLMPSTSEKEIHQTERNMELVQYIGADCSDLAEWIHIDDSECDALKREFVRQHPNVGSGVIGLHIGASKIENRWPVKKFCELADLLHTQYDMTIIVFWGPKEDSLASQFLDSIRFKPIAVEPSTLRKLALYYTLCNAVVCNDTGTMHLCAAVGTPLVSLFGPTNPKYWKPIGDRFIAIRGRNHLVENITVNQVCREVLKLLKR
ncbi:glycosyltransferase family 9 protein [bacterium]|nr:glycosyltransferase family 9 protein [bacterium]